MARAIAFGEAERWARVFSELAAQGRFTAQPDRYAGNTGYSTGYLSGSITSIGSVVSSFSEIANSSMTSTPSFGASSGFSSGGGFSGGGDGGGSW